MNVLIPHMLFYVYIIRLVSKKMDPVKLLRNSVLKQMVYNSKSVSNFEVSHTVVNLLQIHAP